MRKSVAVEKSRVLQIAVDIFSPDRELPAEWGRLALAAREACAGSYAPYSGFSVGAAVELASGTVLRGANQENGSYPCGLCAERVALFSAMAVEGREPVRRMAVAARRGTQWVQRPVTPCGACRQVMLEVAQMQRGTFALLMLGELESLVVRDVRALLPLAFTLDA